MKKATRRRVLRASPAFCNRCGVRLRSQNLAPSRFGRIAKSCVLCANGADIGKEKAR